ncbi:MAG: T9SS type B sorting domain-containing protein [Limnohabitans sp.]|nr:T9SS type B sorting domain-containing protein [Limnohabitans sp.]
MKWFWLFFCSSFLFAQQEATYWYFGEFAGIKFNTDGSVTTLTDGNLRALEACSTVSSASGQLLMYTNGMKVYNKNHQVMPNGNGLNSNISTTQTGIVSKPGNPNLYYIFTQDEEAKQNGFCYSVVDMTLDGGLGDVTNEKNVQVYTPSCEKVAIVKHANNVDYWIITHGWNSNSYYAHLLTATGLNPTPVISNVGSVIQGRSSTNVIGYLKIAPNGTKIAACHLEYYSPTQINGTVELFDFDGLTGIISNPQILLLDEKPYGIEFSPNSEILYQPSLKYKTIFQYDLNAADIPNSKRSIYQNDTFNFIGLQLAPNDKIYVTRLGDTKLAVINNPDVLGAGCNFVLDGVDLNGKMCLNGLPSFPSSYFKPQLNLSSNCEDENIQFTITTNQTILGVNWDFGDSSLPQNSIIGNHSYTNPGTYTIVATVSIASGIKTFRKTVTILAKPTINSNVSLKQCDDDLDGFSAFNLTEANSKISTNYANETFSYYRTAGDAQNKTNPITNFTAYTNQVVSNDIVYVRVENANGCFRIAQLDLNVSTTQVPVNFTRTFTVCDDNILGTNTDGITAFNFSSVDTQVRDLFPPGQQLTITYYRNLADALAEQNKITDTSNYRNIGYPNTQNIYTRVDSDTNNDCLLLKTFITLTVERIPITQPLTLVHCDDDQDGKYGFDTTHLQTTLLNGLTDVSVSYFDENNNSLPSPLPNPFVTASQIVKVIIKNNTPTACDYQTTITFTVDDLPQIFPIPTTSTTICDDEAEPSLQDGKYAFDTAAFQNIILGSQTGMIVKYFDAANNPLSSPLPNPFVTNTQNIRVEVINPSNTTCVANGTIPFVVHPVPKINLTGDELVCNEKTLTKTINAEITDGTPQSNYTYVWKRNGILLPSETNYTLNVNQEGSYTVEVTNAQGCTRTRTITVRASDIATIQNIAVTELSDNNSIVVSVTGQGDYVYSIDGVNYQTENTFSGIPAGVYTVYIKDLNGCGIADRTISVLGIPKFFTPNGDGYNDFWNIQGANAKLNSKTEILIFNRFGKLLKQISPMSQGWDGTFNGEQQTSDDYWYSITLENGQIIKGHFALKR